MTDGTGTTTYGYDAASRLTSVTYPGGLTLAYAYNDADRRTTLTDASDGETTYEYDPVGNMTSITNPFGETTTIAYDALNRESTKTLANGVVVTHTYDDGGRETELSYTLDGSPVADFVSTYDNVGNRLTEIELDGSVTTYVYDANNQLTDEIRTGPTPYTGSYAYDAAGNRATGQLPKLASVTKPYNFSYAVDHANALESLTDTDSSTVYDYAYDNNGNLTGYDTPYNGTVGSVAHTWDEENRLTAVTAADGTVSTHAYAGDGMRRVRETPSGTTTFVWDHENVLQEFESDGSTVYYTEHPGASGGLISRREGSTTGSPLSRFYIHDPSNHTRHLMDESGAIVESYLLDAFGNVVSSAVIGSNVNASQVPAMDAAYGGLSLTPASSLQLYAKLHGYHWDKAANDVRRLYVRARHFDTETAKWMSRDPFGDVDGPNRYGYCGNDGVNFFDPHGTDGASNFHHHRKLRIKVGPTTYSHDPYYLAPTSVPSTNGYSIDMAHAAGSKDYLYWLDNDENYQATYAFAADQRLKQGAREQKAAADRDLMLSFVPIPGLGGIGIGLEAVGGVRDGVTVFIADRRIGGALKRAYAAAGKREVDETAAHYGTRVHTFLAQEIVDLGKSHIRPEVSYRMTREVLYGTRRSVRLDVIVVSKSGRILRAYDLKTGVAGLTASRIARMRRHLPMDSANVVIKESRRR